MEVLVVLNKHSKPVNGAFFKRGFNVTTREPKLLPKTLNEHTFEFVVTDLPVDYLPSIRSAASDAAIIVVRQRWSREEKVKALHHGVDEC